MEDKQKINCWVSSCQYNDTDKEKCTLNEINVEPVEECETCEPDESMCGSYEFADTADETDNG